MVLTPSKQDYFGRLIYIEYTERFKFAHMG